MNKIAKRTPRVISYVAKTDAITARKVAALIELAASRSRYLAVCYLFGMGFFLHAGALYAGKMITFDPSPGHAMFYGVALLAFGGYWYAARRRLYRALDKLEDEGTLPP